MDIKIYLNPTLIITTSIFVSRLQLQSPGHYSPLEAFYEDKRALLPPSGEAVVTVCPANAWGAAINHSMHPEMKVCRMFPLPELAWTRVIAAFNKLVYLYVSRSPTRQVACPSSSASLGSRSWCCGNWLFCAGASSFSRLHPWVWSATEVRNAHFHIQFVHLGLIFLLYLSQCTAAAAWQTSRSPVSAWPCQSSAPSSTSTLQISVHWRTSSPTLPVSCCSPGSPGFAGCSPNHCVFATAGTTEKIFEEKKDLYDVYVDNQNVKTCRDGLKPLLRLSAADREKYRKLTEQRFDQYNGKHLHFTQYI